MMADTHKRTFTKTISYRVINTLITFLMTFLLFGVSAELAGSVALAQIILGSVIFYLYDRVWLHVAWARTEIYEDVKRSIIKTIGYRLIVLCAGFIIARVILTSNNETAVWWTVTSMILSMIFYYIHDRIWLKIKWGRIE
jgi:hypothetical protein